MKFMLLTATVALLTFGGQAAESTFILPSSFADVEDDGWSHTFSSPPSIRLQEVYGAAMFPQRPITITEIRWRRDAWHGSAEFGVVSDVSLSISTTQREPEGLSNYFAENIGVDVAEVFRGELVVPPPVELPPGAIRPFDIVIRLDHPFRYDPAEGNLLLDIRTPVAMPGMLGVDAPNDYGDGASRVFSWSVDEVWGPSDAAADVIQVVWENDLPSEPFTLHLSASPAQLWPPHGQRVPVTLTAVGETADGQLWPRVNARIVSVVCNEVYGKAARDKRNPQWVVTGDMTLNLVAKKFPGRMHMRIYTITVQAEGEEGNISTAQIRVVVPASAPGSNRSR